MRRPARGTQAPRVYRVPGLRVSVVRERWVETRRRPIVATTAGLAAALRAGIPADDDREHFVMAVLDVRQRLLAVHTVSIGGARGTLVHPRDLLRIAVLMGASTIGVGHNHCSGDPEPSKEDIELTRRLMRSVELMGMRFADHVIFGRDDRWISLRERGCLEVHEPSQGQPKTKTVSVAAGKTQRPRGRSRAVRSASRS